MRIGRLTVVVVLDWPMENLRITAAGCSKCLDTVESVVAVFVPFAGPTGCCYLPVVVGQIVSRAGSRMVCGACIFPLC